jgi:hypothetical protein
MTKYLAPVVMLACLTSIAAASVTADSKKVGETENIYAEVNDAASIIATIDSGLFTSYRGKDRAAWDRFYGKKRKELAEHLSNLPNQGLSAGDAKAVAAMRTQLASFAENISAPFSSHGTCQDAKRMDQDYASLRKELVACFVENDNNLYFEGKKINWQSALDLLHEIEEPARRWLYFLLSLRCGRPSTVTTNGKVPIAA